jgi:hypothetical protein
VTKRRAIYGTAATSLSLARCCPEAQLLFDRLITAADDQGRLQGDPLLVKAACMPLVDRATIRKVDGWLDELAEGGMIQRYEAGEQALIQIVKWWEHQDWMRHAYASRWPGPRGWDDRMKGSGLPPDDGGSAADGRHDAGEMPAPRPRDAGPSESESGVSGGVELEKEASESGGESEAPTATQPLNLLLHRITTNHRDLTGKLANGKAIEMYSDLIRKFGVDIVAQAQYRCANFDKADYGFVGRVKTECKRLAA